MSVEISVAVLVAFVGLGVREQNEATEVDFVQSLGDLSLSGLSMSAC